MTRPTTAQLNAAYDQFNFWYDKAKKLDEELAKAEERIAELEEEFAFIMGQNDGMVRELEESRETTLLVRDQWQKDKERADAAEKQLATPVRLPTTSGRLGVAYTRVIPEVIEAIRDAGFTVEGDK